MVIAESELAELGRRRDITSPKGIQVEMNHPSLQNQNSVGGKQGGVDKIILKRRKKKIPKVI